MKIFKPIHNLNFLSAAKSGKLKKVEEAIGKGADKDARDGNGWTAWMYAYANCHNEVAKFLESSGVEVTDADRLTASITARMNKACNVLPSAKAHTQHHHIKWTRG